VALFFVELPPDFTQLLFFFSSGDETAIKRALPKCSIFLSAPPKPLVAVEAAEAVIRRVVAAAPPGKLNWDVNKDRSLWDCVTIAGAGDRFAVNFGSFQFRSRVDLADLARIFGTELVSLVINNEVKLEGEPFL